MILYLVNRMSTGLLYRDPQGSWAKFYTSPRRNTYLIKGVAGCLWNGFVFLFFLYLAQLCTVNGTSFNLRNSTEFWSR
jgi:hypothetical protein